MNDDNLIAAVRDISEAIKPLLAGKSPQVQGVVLANLLAVWLGGHVVPDDPEATMRLRADLLSAHFRWVCSFVPMVAQEP